MKKIILLLLMLLTCLSVFAFSFGMGADFGIIQDVLIKTGAYQANADLRAGFSDSYELRVPVSVDISNGVYFAEAGVSFVYYPWQKGFFMGLSAVQIGYSVNQRIYDKTIFNLNEVLLGWTFDLPFGLFMEPSIAIRDPSGTYQDEYSAILGAWPNYQRFRLRVILGWKYSIEEGDVYEEK